MSDLISRQAAIDVAFDVYPDDEYFRELFVKGIEAISDAPTIEVERKHGEWILCSERMPEKPGRYIVTEQNGNVDTALYDAPIKQFTRAVVAWMPLPQPYESDMRGAE